MEADIFSLVTIAAIRAIQVKKSATTKAKHSAVLNTLFFKKITPISVIGVTLFYSFFIRSREPSGIGRSKGIFTVIIG